MLEEENKENTQPAVEPTVETTASVEQPAPVAVENPTVNTTTTNNNPTNTNKPNRKKEVVNLNRKTTKGKISATGFEEKVVGIKKVSKTTKGGRRMRFSALVVIGDHNGKVGYGIGKANEVPNAIKKAIKNARNNVQKVIINKKGTVYHEVIGHLGASKVLIKPAPEGAGIMAGGAIRAVIELAGYKDIYTKNLGSNSALNMVQATLLGLLQQRSPKAVAELRDKELKNL